MRTVVGRDILRYCQIAKQNRIECFPGWRVPVVHPDVSITASAGDAIRRKSGKSCSATGSSRSLSARAKLACRWWSYQNCDHIFGRPRHAVSGSTDRSLGATPITQQSWRIGARWGGRNSCRLSALSATPKIFTLTTKYRYPKAEVARPIISESCAKIATSRNTTRSCSKGDEIAHSTFGQRIVPGSSA